MPIKDKKTKDGKWLYKIRPYIKYEDGTTKQTTIHGNWIGRDGFLEAQKLETRLKDNIYPIGAKWDKSKQDFISSNIQIKKNTDITLAELEEEYLNHISKNLDKDTLNGHRNKLNHFCQKDKTNQVTTYPDIKVKLITQDMFEKWQSEMILKTYKKGKYDVKISIEHLNRIYGSICNMIDYAVLKEYCKTNFARLCNKFGTTKEQQLSSKHREYITIDYDEYLELMEVSKDDLKFNTYFDLEFKRGPRTGEIRAFRICDYNEKEKTLMVNHTMNKKNELKEPKTAASKAPIRLSDELNTKIKLLITKLSLQRGFNDNWYIFGNSNPISSNALNYNKEKYFKKAGIMKHLRLHDLRHSCATWLFSMNIPITVISKILRHSSIEETMKTYVHLTDKDYDHYLNVINNCYNKTK